MAAGNAGRSQNEFVSVDSAPKGFSAPVPLWRAPCLLICFLCLSAGLLWSLDNVPVMQATFSGGDLVAAPFSGGHSVPLRVFVISYMLAFAIFSHGKLLWRIGFGADMLVTYLLLCTFVDLTALIYDVLLDSPMSLHVIEILSGFLGYAVYSFKLLERGNMPSRIPIDEVPQNNEIALLRLIGVIFAAGIITILISAQIPGLIGQARQIALLGGIGPGVFLFLPMVFILLYVMARIDTVTQDKGEFAPPLTVIIPAHNEEYIIEGTIEAIDKAAERYGGPVSILVMDNNSKDETTQVATEALQACRHAFGRVVAEPKPGKSHALNAALDATQTEYVVRIDADTLVGPDSLHYAMRRMKDPKVGVVGGLPIPPGGGPFDHARLLELVVKHGFYSVGLSAVNSVVGVPGMFAAYRTELPRRLGGFVQGMNGEDTDMSLRIGELGYRLISEVPVTYAHLREQRMRWFRSVFHVAARCRDLIYSGRPSVRGKIMLPFMLLNSAMRAMMVPMILFGALLLVLPGIAPRDLPWQGVLAVGIGAPALMSVMCALLNKSARGLLYVPEYLLFRLLRAYFTLESNLSITVKDHGQHLYSEEALARPPDKEPRQA